jgi:hypothetical protein
MILTSFILWLLFNACMGYIEGAYWHFRNAVVLSKHYKTPYATTLNLHSILFVVRVLFAIALQNTSIYFITALILSQPYFHLGMMYLHRNKLDSRVYPLRFKDCNKVELHESSKIDLFLYNIGLKQITYRLRLICLIIAGLIIVVALFHLSTT